jgi:hypothetical protein
MCNTSSTICAPSPSVQQMTAVLVLNICVIATIQSSLPAAGPSTVADDAPEEESPELRRSACGKFPAPAHRPAAGRVAAAAGGRPRGVLAPPACGHPDVRMLPLCKCISQASGECPLFLVVQPCSLI